MALGGLTEFASAGWASTNLDCVFVLEECVTAVGAGLCDSEGRYLLNIDFENKVENAGAGIGCVWAGWA